MNDQNPKLPDAPASPAVLPVLRRLGRLYDQLIRLKDERRLFLVGGALRDMLLNRESADFDFAVSGSGIDFAGRFARRTRSKLVILSESDDEARVVCGSGTVLDFNGLGDRSIEQDLSRRDFTINALACELFADSTGELLDPLNGRADIARRLIRLVSPASLSSDPLRLLRAIRHALELGFEIDAAVYEQARTITLRNTAGERIGAELLRIMEQPGSYPHILKLAELNLLTEILPGLAGIMADPLLGEHTLKTYARLEEIIHGQSFFSRFAPEWNRYFDPPPDTADAEPETVTPTATPAPYRRALLKLAGLLHDIAKPDTQFITSEGEMHFYGHDSLGARNAARMLRDNLRFSRPQTRMVRTLIQEHMRLHLLATAPDLSERAIRRFFRDLGEQAFGLMLLCVADGWATAGRTIHLEETITRMIDQQRAEAAKVRIERFVTGHDLIALGMRPGPAFKVILQELEDLQVEGRIKSKAEGLAYLKAHLAGGADSD